MRRFILKVIGFIAIPMLYFMLCMAINYFIYSTQSPKLEVSRILIAGDSHSEKSLNPSLFNSAQNISQPAEPYFLTFWKLKNILKYYSPDTLIVGFAHHNISAFNDLKVGNHSWADEMFKRSYTFHQFHQIDDHIHVDLLGFYKVLFNHTAFYPNRNHVHYIGKFQNNEGSNVSNWKSSIKRHYYANDSLPGISLTSLNYLDSIVSLGQIHNVQLVLSGSPVYKEYYNHIPKTIREEYEALKTRYSETTIIYDRTNDTSYSDSLLLDSDHLNAKGAKKYTTSLNHFLQSTRND